MIGGPGAGKTVLSLETLCNAAANGCPGVFLSFEERADAVRANAASMGWDLAALADSGRVAVVHPQLDYRAVRAGQFSIDGLLAVIKGHAEQIHARFVIIDAIDALLRLFIDHDRRDDALYRLHDWLLEQGFTTILTVKSRASGHGEPGYWFLDFLADCVLLLDQRIIEQITTRRLHVVKYRGSGFSSNESPFVITPRGLVVMPVSSADLVQRPLGELCSSGHETLDAMLGGGYRKGSAVLVAGPTGSGKTTLACTFARAAGQRRERTLYVSFEEGEESILGAMETTGLDLRQAVEQGYLKILTALPESLGIEEHLLRILDAMDRFNPDHLVVDAISATQRMGSQTGGYDFLVRLLTCCARRAITTVYLNQAPYGRTTDSISGVGISSLIDTALILDYVWDRDTLGRSIFVLKSRGTSHCRQIHRLDVSDQGLIIDPPAERGAQRGGAA